MSSKLGHLSCGPSQVLCSISGQTGSLSRRMPIVSSTCSSCEELRSRSICHVRETAGKLGSCKRHPLLIIPDNPDMNSTMILRCDTDANFQYGGRSTSRNYSEAQVIEHKAALQLMAILVLLTVVQLRPSS